ncbi:hypothetical protein KEJ51_06055 [Candidatus Bathyarchaeota archaeon]|nr:hypothetical protein [Candidatus Bathyarchaeota archaeon]MBS7629131.1 hypothetical protein [Candidatus Bathyarchaeota archaeon]
MITGALAASYYGVPRTTMDVDVIVRVSRRSMLSNLISALKVARLIVNEKRLDSVFNSKFRIATLRDRDTPFTLDIIFSSRKLNKRAGSISGLPTFYQTPEDLILAKLRMVKATIPKDRALKDMDDIRAILKFSKVKIGVIKREARKDSTLHILEDLIANV